MANKSKARESHIAVSEALRQDIVFGRLKPRERLVEEELSERFDCGRYAIRMALEEVMQLGLVVRRPNKGAAVIDYTPDEIEQLYHMRTLLQTESVRLIRFPVSEEVIATLEACNKLFAEKIAAHELAEAAKANDLFHHTLFNCCNNKYLCADIESYWLKTASIHSYAIGNADMASRSFDEHAEMIALLAAGDRDELARKCDAHMRPALTAYLAAQAGTATFLKSA